MTDATSSYDDLVGALEGMLRMFGGYPEMIPADDARAAIVIAYAKAVLKNADHSHTESQTNRVT